MIITADTNVLLRSMVRDDPKQAQIAEATLQDARLVAITIPTLCEIAWVLTQVYKRSSVEVATAIRLVLSSGNVVINRPTVEAGLAMLDAGGDFADGAIAFEGASLGGEEFVSFDRRAVKLLTNQGRAARAL